MSSWFVPLLFGTAFVGQAFCTMAPAALQLSAETAPAGGWAQIKIYAAKPVPIASGHLVLNLDSTAFGAGAMVGLFGANGDAAGLATVTLPNIDVQFSSATGGIGQLAGLPVMVISVPVLASASGRTVAVSATSPDSSVSVASGSVVVKGTLSVEKIPAGMGVVAAGSVVPVFGTGFTALTTVKMEGVEIAATKFVSAQEIDVTLGGATELVGKLARVTDSGAEFDYFCFQPNDPVNSGASSHASALANVQPLFPLFASTGLWGNSFSVGDVIAVENPNPAAATVSFANVNIFGPLPQTSSQVNLPIPAGSWAIFDGESRAVFVVKSNLPVRAIAMAPCGPPFLLPVCLAAAGPVGGYPFLSPPAMTPSSLVFGWQMGASTFPAARTVSVSPGNVAFTLTAKTESGGPWLSVTPQTLTALSVSVDPSHLTAGTYQGSIVATESYGPLSGPSAALPVSLTVTDAVVPSIAATPSNLSFSAPAFNSAPYSETVSVTSDSGPAAFSVTLQRGTWLQVSPMSGTTPATLTVTWDPAVTSQIFYLQRSTPASISISGLGNTITVPATFNVTGVESGAGPNGLVFSAQTGSPSQAQTLYVVPSGTITATVDQPWMSAAATASGGTVIVSVDPAGLVGGVYHGTVTVGEPGMSPKAVPVTLGVWSSPPSLTITTGSFTFVQTVGEILPANQTAEVDSGGVPVPLTTSSGASWLQVLPYGAPTPAPILVGVNGLGSPGEYKGAFTIQSPGNSINVPVTLLVESGPAAPPVLSQVVNAASGIAGGVSPGEILTIRGYSAGASAVSGLKLDASGGVMSNLNGLQVTFDGKSAPLIYTSANQTNLIVPYEVAGRTSTVIQVVYAAAAGTLQTAAWVLPVTGSVPGVFTLDATGTGPAAVLNQDGSINSATNPAARGSVISIYATGEGQTSPAGVTGSVAQSNTKTPLLPVTAKIGGTEATVQYAGSAPGEVAGVLQVNAVIPAGLSPGPDVLVLVSIGGIASQSGVTIAVK
jgi:uncharacterized protein (TIGR03437 family)